MDAVPVISNESQRVYTTFTSMAFRSRLKEACKLAGEWDAWYRYRKALIVHGYYHVQAGLISSAWFPVARMVYERALQSIYGDKYTYDDIVRRAINGARLSLTKPADQQESFKPSDGGNEMAAPQHQAETLDEALKLIPEKPSDPIVPQEPQKRVRKRTKKETIVLIPPPPEHGKSKAQMPMYPKYLNIPVPSDERKLERGRRKLEAAGASGLDQSRIEGGTLRELAEALKGKRCGIQKQIEWAAEHSWKIAPAAPVPFQLLASAPSDGAVAWLMFATSSPQAYQTFFQTVVTKIVPSRSTLDAENKVRDDSARHSELIDTVYRCLAPADAGGGPALPTADPPAAQAG